MLVMSEKVGNFSRDIENMKRTKWTFYLFFSFPSGHFRIKSTMSEINFMEDITSRIEMIVKSLYT